ncbi:hypothetical protein M378DRAFT_7828 [Amanita muscaria Koide BX008]|uniref:SWI5-dependent HO expression protein 3 n=1 Tax=Amanita muscaria (strain Koide BX008) TaxID=946122 RepID=A0A0C2XI16_AMAMK|nr:hypothetical protein M378DRAFT_7828 [Amanita muscaria Koide BX008]
MSSNPIPTTTERNLSSLKHHREASLSRPSSRGSFRAHSPSYSLDDPVSIRTQMSTIKHDIRQKQAQLNSLETIIRTVPRPYSTELLLDNYTTPASMSTTPPPPSSFPVSKATKMQRRSSYDVLQGIAGPDSSLPLPKREGANLEDGSIPEGIPMSFGASTSPNHQRRPSSPTRSLSRIPVSAVGNARALAEEVNGSTPQRSLSYSKLSPVEVDTPSSLTLQPPSPSPNGRRTSLVNGGTTKVLADLQLGVINARTALENTKAQLRLSQRTVAQLTRQTEDLKEGRERLRLENEGLNNVVARKERLLQEVLERARKAEAEAASLKAQLKTETTTSKKAVREMEAALHESTALSQKSEREYLTLRDSIKGLVESFKVDADRLREEMRRREEQWRNEAESVGKKYRLLLEKIKDAEEDRLDVKKQHEEDQKLNQGVEQHWIEEIQRMKEEVERSNKESEETAKTAKSLAAELARLRRLMQSAGRSALDDQNPPPP